MGLKTYVGVADCHGIESLSFKDDTSSQDRAIRQIRADANRHRHAVYFEADICETTFKIIDELLEKQQYTEALECLKRFGHVMSPKQHQNSWKLIPNPELDPYG